MPVRPVCIVICTFNRADDCLNTLRALSEDEVAMGVVTDVVVVDQGTDLVTSRPGFDKVAAALGARLQYVEQRNLGGPAASRAGSSS